MPFVCEGGDKVTFGRSVLPLMASDIYTISLVRFLYKSLS